MTFGLRSATGSASASAAPAAGSRRAASHILVSATAIFLVVGLNILAIENAPKLTPGKLALFPANLYPWTLPRLAGQ